MSCFIRKVTTASGATAALIIYKDGRIISSINHIGSAHNAMELEFLLALAKKQMHAGQLTIDLFTESSPDIYTEAAYSELLWDVLEDS